MQTPWKRTFALLYFHPHNVPNPSGSAGVHHFLSSLKPNFELEALRQNGLHFLREKKGVSNLTLLESIDLFFSFLQSLLSLSYGRF